MSPTTRRACNLNEAQLLSLLHVLDDGRQVEDLDLARAPVLSLLEGQGLGSAIASIGPCRSRSQGLQDCGVVARASQTSVRLGARESRVTGVRMSPCLKIKMQLLSFFLSGSHPTLSNRLLWTAHASQYRSPAQENNRLASASGSRYYGSCF